MDRPGRETPRTDRGVDVFSARLQASMLNLNECPDLKVGGLHCVAGITVRGGRFELPRKDCFGYWRHGRTGPRSDDGVSRSGSYRRGYVPRRGRIRRRCFRGRAHWSDASGGRVGGCNRRRSRREIRRGNCGEARATRRPGERVSADLPAEQICGKWTRKSTTRCFS